MPSTSFPKIMAISFEDKEENSERGIALGVSSAEIT
jgi:hypothetical protein